MSKMKEQVLVSAGVLGSRDDLNFLMGLATAHSFQRASDPRGARMLQRRSGAFISEHRIGAQEIHVREEYLFGMIHRYFVMTLQERIGDTGEFLEFERLGFSEAEGDTP
jgi:hypothetical protein